MAPLEKVFGPLKIADRRDDRGKLQRSHHHHRGHLGCVPPIADPHSKVVAPGGLVGRRLPQQQTIGLNRHSCRSLHQSVLQGLPGQINVAGSDQCLQFEAGNDRQLGDRIDERDFVQLGGDGHQSVGRPDNAIRHGDPDVVGGGRLTLTGTPEDQTLRRHAHADGAIHQPEPQGLLGHIGIESPHHGAHFKALHHAQFRSRVDPRRLVDFPHPHPKSIGGRHHAIAHPPRNPKVPWALHFRRGPSQKPLWADTHSGRTTGKSVVQRLDRDIYIAGSQGPRPRHHFVDGLVSDHEGNRQLIDLTDLHGELIGHDRSAIADSDQQPMSPRTLVLGGHPVQKAIGPHGETRGATHRPKSQWLEREIHIRGRQLKLQERPFPQNRIRDARQHGRHIGLQDRESKSHSGFRSTRQILGDHIGREGARTLDFFRGPEQPAIRAHLEPDGRGFESEQHRPPRRFHRAGLDQSRPQHSFGQWREGRSRQPRGIGDRSHLQIESPGNLSIGCIGTELKPATAVAIQSGANPKSATEDLRIHDSGVQGLLQRPAHRTHRTREKRGQVQGQRCGILEEAQLGQSSFGMGRRPCGRQGSRDPGPRTGDEFQRQNDTIGRPDLIKKVQSDLTGTQR